MPAVLDALVLALLEESNHPLTAYQIAGRSDERGAPMTATQVYRVLDRLISDGKVQRIELLAAYLPVQSEPQGFIVCRCCQAVQTVSVTGLRSAAYRVCRAAGFAASRSIFEVSGVCADCARRETGDAGVVKRQKIRSVTSRLRELLILTATAGAIFDAGPVEAVERPGKKFAVSRCSLGNLRPLNAAECQGTVRFNMGWLDRHGMPTANPHFVPRSFQLCRQSGDDKPNLVDRADYLPVNHISVSRSVSSGLSFFGTLGIRAEVPSEGL